MSNGVGNGRGGPGSEGTLPRRMGGPGDVVSFTTRLVEGATARAPDETAGRHTHPFQELSTCQELDVEFEEQERILWCFMRPEGRPCFTPGLLEDSRRVQHALERQFIFHHDTTAAPLNYLILASRVPGIFNLGGDLRLISRLVRDKDRDGLLRYARACIDVCFGNALHGDFPIITISLVQGEALGGGFEAALSANVLIAEKGSQFGLPEVLFNLFPGMGAYNFLSRRIGGAAAERLILNGNILKAEELYEMGVIDVLAEEGHGIEAVYAYIDQQQSKRNAQLGVYSARQAVSPIQWQELMEVGRIWVDAALSVSERDVRKMERLVAAQERRLQARMPGI